MSRKFLDEAEKRSTHELLLLVKFIVFQTADKRYEPTRRIAMKAAEWNKILESKKQGQLPSLNKNEQIEFKKMLDILPDKIFEDSVSTGNLQARMRKAKSRVAGEKKSEAIYVSVKTASRLRKISSKEEWGTLQECIIFLMDYYINNEKNANR